MPPETMQPNMWQALGAFIPAVAIAVSWIWHLRRALSRQEEQADRRADALLALAERALPALQASTASVAESTAIIRRTSEQLAIAEVVWRDAEATIDELRR